MREGYAKLGLSGKSNVTACGPRYRYGSGVALQQWAAQVNTVRSAMGERPYDYVCWFTAGGKKLSNEPLGGEG